MKQGEAERKNYLLACLELGQATVRQTMKTAGVREPELARWLRADPTFKAKFYDAIHTGYLLAKLPETGNPKDQGTSPQPSGSSRTVLGGHDDVSTHEEAS